MCFEIFQGVRDRWYWRLISEDERKIAFSSKGYLTKQDILRDIDKVKKVAHGAFVKELSL
ncbi:hypothetical protein BAnh1_08560 [Bartonella australis AUST/NH1]|uniref:DUF1508 domain-containing protein n=1 Tax=Bartonella australis (strain Aust/NH1) TaxID=1094489 RepID=M1NZ62_BARAA|nr:DUF1508 domain-containing protein [Bartonella australis]AGF74732.1 hypothetical protein BAnh1_08560 [Bartonella australis AUST/NH1]